MKLLLNVSLLWAINGEAKKIDITTNNRIIFFTETSLFLFGFGLGFQTGFNKDADCF